MLLYHLEFLVIRDTTATAATSYQEVNCNQTSSIKQRIQQLDAILKANVAIGVGETNTADHTKHHYGGDKQTSRKTRSGS